MGKREILKNDVHIWTNLKLVCSKKCGMIIYPHWLIPSQKNKTSEIIACKPEMSMLRINIFLFSEK